MLTDLTRKLFALQHLRGVGPSSIEKLASQPGLSIDTILDQARGHSKISKALDIPGSLETAEEQAAKDIEAASIAGVRLICALDDEYPSMLRLTRSPPFFLFVKGSFFHRPARSVAIIGTRQPTAHGVIITERITEYFVANGWSIISGLALGCDAAAHRAALAAGGHTVAILAHGLHTIAPRQHASLAEEILDKGGALVTEYSIGVEPISHQFVKRDRIQAGLAAGVVMIQSDKDGGSLHASRAALEYGRTLGVPFPTIHDQEGREPKIAANLILAEGGTEERMALLKCNANDLERVLVLRAKSDYPLLESRLKDIGDQVEHQLAVHPIQK